LTYDTNFPIPPLRIDISGFNDMNQITLYDENNLDSSQVSFNNAFWGLLQLLDGRKTVNDLCNLAKKQDIEKVYGVSLNEFEQVLLEIINSLEAACLLNSMSYLDYKNREDAVFEKLNIRPSKFAGSSYPNSPVELKEKFDEYLLSGRSNEKPIGIIAPHIDFRVGGSSYGYAFNSLKNSDADTFIILGTAHKLSYDRFMFCTKDFDTPLGVVKTDKEFIRSFKNNLDFEITKSEIAHKDEHSIEFEVVMLKHIFPDRDIQIVPILCGSLHDYVELGIKKIQSDDTFNKLYHTLTKTIAQLNRKVCYIASSDMSHIGLKFGDSDTANTFIHEVQKRDKEILWLLENCKTDDFINYLRATKNEFRICGVSPIYAMLKAINPKFAKVLCYDSWDEYEQGSAVSFASVAFYE